MTKRALDISLAMVAAVILAVPALLTAVAVAATSRGPVIHWFDRVGRHGRIFRMPKFRTMKQDTPQLATDRLADPRSRLTPVGGALRKLSLDEIPQLWSVLKGDMSLVGPRPERQHFIDEIIKVAPHYRHLHKVRPGITSWGQVKFGYAENVDQMLRRLKYDILYIENMSLAVDLKILAYTALIMLKGDGK